jgi:hypothetical protein
VEPGSAHPRRRRARPRRTRLLPGGHRDRAAGLSLCAGRAAQPDLRHDRVRLSGHGLSGARMRPDVVVRALPAAARLIARRCCRDVPAGAEWNLDGAVAGRLATPGQGRTGGAATAGEADRTGRTADPSRSTASARGRRWRPVPGPPSSLRRGCQPLRSPGLQCACERARSMAGPPRRRLDPAQSATAVLQRTTRMSQARRPNSVRSRSDRSPGPEWTASTRQPSSTRRRSRSAGSLGVSSICRRAE